MKNFLFLLLLSSCAWAGSIFQVSDSSTTINTPVTELQVGGSSVVRVSSSASNGYQLLIKNPVIGETPNIASISNPLTGFILSSGDSGWCYNRVQHLTFRRSGTDGNGHLMINGWGKKESEAYEPHIQNEQAGSNKDGLTFIDNRLPDGVTGHDPAGRFVALGVAGNNTLKVGVSTVTATGVIHSLSGGFKFPDGSVQTTAAGASSTFDHIVLTPRATPPPSPVFGMLYVSSSDRQAYFYDGSQWVIAW